MEKDQISLALALEDFLPVVLFALGLFFVARMIAAQNKTAGNLAYTGGVLITLGGVFKVFWKVIQAVGGGDIFWLNDSLFVLMSAGFVCSAWALWRSSKPNSVVAVWLAPLILIAVFWTIAAYFGFVRSSRVWFFVLLGATTVFNIWLCGQLIFRSAKNGLWFAAALFATNIICAVLLSRMSDQTITLQWIKQIINTISQGAFALAAWFLYTKSTRLN